LSSSISGAPRIHYIKNMFVDYRPVSARPPFVMYHAQYKVQVLQNENWSICPPWSYGRRASASKPSRQSIVDDAAVEGRWARASRKTYFLEMNRSHCRYGLPSSGPEVLCHMLPRRYNGELVSWACSSTEFSYHNDQAKSQAAASNTASPQLFLNKLCTCAH
jgi:hypothetical protein